LACEDAVSVERGLEGALAKPERLLIGVNLMETPTDLSGLLSGHAAVLVEFDWPVCHRVTSLSWFARPA
jgi:hypothetical protein